MLARDVRWFSKRQHPFSWTSFIKEVSGTYYAHPGDKCRVIICDTSTNPVTGFLPSAADVGQGAMITIKDNGGGDTNSVTVRGKTTSDMIDGGNIVTLDSAYSSLPVVSDGKKWLIL